MGDLIAELTQICRLINDWEYFGFDGSVYDIDDEILVVVANYGHDWIELKKSNEKWLFIGSSFGGEDIFTQNYLDAATELVNGTALSSLKTLQDIEAEIKKNSAQAANLLARNKQLEDRKQSLIAEVASLKVVNFRERLRTLDRSIVSD